MQKKHGRSRLHKALRPDDPVVMLGATLLLAFGVIGIALLSSRISGKRPSMPASVPGVDMMQDEVPVLPPTAVLLLLNEDSATLVRMDGTQQRIPLADLEKRFAGKTRPTEGSNAANGSPAIYPDPSLAKGDIPSPDGAYAAHLADPRADGATAILLKPVGGTARTVVLRMGDRPLRDGAFAGWFDRSTMAIVAYTETAKAVFAAGLDGSLRLVAALPDDVAMSSVRAGAFWYITAVQGAGIEVPPTPPSELHRVTMDGKDVLMAREESRVISGILADGQGRVAYDAADGRSELIGLGLPEGHVSLGARRPIAILPDGRVVLREGFGISAFDPATGESVSFGELPEGNVSVFVSDLPLDAPAP